MHRGFERLCFSEAITTNHHLQYVRDELSRVINSNQLLTVYLLEQYRTPEGIFSKSTFNYAE